MRRQIGRRHVQVGLADRYMYVACQLIEDEVLGVLQDAPGSAWTAMRSLRPVLTLDLALMTGTYVEARERKQLETLADRVAAAQGMGIAPDRIAIDPGIGFGKTLGHNLALLRGLSLLHGLGLPILLGASRKRFIGTIGGAGDGAARMPGSVAVALAGVAQGVQMIRVHDVAETRQALKLWQAIAGDHG